MSVRARLTLALVLGLVLGISLSAADRVLADHAPATSRPASLSAGHAALPWSDARLLAEVMQRIRENYVDAVDDHTLIQYAIRGMVEALDDHSTFLNPEEFQDMRVSTSGAYAGIGVEVAPGKDGVSILRRMPNSPAERAAFPEQAWRGQHELRASDVALLAAHESAGSFLDRPPSELEATVDSDPGDATNTAASESTPAP